MREVKYFDIGLVITKHEEGKLYNVSRETLEEVDILDVIEYLTGNARKDKAEYFVAWCGLKYQRMTIVNILYKLGYTYIDGANKKDLRVKEYRGRFSQGKCFYLQIKTGKNSYVTLQAVETVIGLKKPAESVEELQNAFKLYHFTRDTFLAGVKKSETRILYSAASISRTMYNRQCKKWQFAELDFRHRKSPKKGMQLNVWLDKFMRRCTHGGFNAMGADAVSYEGNGIVLDVNRLYPYISAMDTLPSTDIISMGYGIPERKYIRHKESYYTFMFVEVSATLKEDGIPCIYADESIMNVSDSLTEMHKRYMTFTEADRKLLYDNYDISYFRIYAYVVFRASRNDFRTYMTDVYNKSYTDDETAHQFYKLMGNGLIGTFAKHTYKDKYYLSEENEQIVLKKRPVPREELNEKINKVSGLCYVNAAIVSGARRYIVNYIKTVKDRWLYTDTDSIHLKGYEIPENIPVSDKMGAFKVEHTFTKVRYYGLKKYLFVERGEVIPTIAGLPKDTFRDLGRVKGVDISYISKALKHQALDRLTKKPIGIYHIVEDIGTMTISYEVQKGWINGEQLSKKERKIKEASKRKEGWEWITSKGIDRSLHNTYGKREVIKHFTAKWNRAIDDGTIKAPTFEDAAKYLKAHC